MSVGGRLMAEAGQGREQKAAGFRVLDRRIRLSRVVLKLEQQVCKVLINDRHVIVLSRHFV